MRVLIVHAHPEPKSFSSAMRSIAVSELEQHGHEVEESDLYAMQFNPIADSKDFLARVDPDYCVYALEQRNAYQTGTLASDIHTEVKKLLWCDLVIFNFPLFWCSTPAILKGWIDRVLISGVAYGGLRFYDKGGLRGKRALVSVTLGGQEHMFQPKGVHGPLNEMLKHLLQGTLAYTGMSVHPPFVAWHVPYINDDAREKILEGWRSYLANLNELDTLIFPSLASFDAELKPVS